MSKERRKFKIGKIYRCTDPERMYSETGVILNNDNGLFVVSNIIGLSVCTKCGSIDHYGSVSGDRSEWICCSITAIEEGWIERDDKE